MHLSIAMSCAEAGIGTVLYSIHSGWANNSQYARFGQMKR